MNHSHDSEINNSGFLLFTMVSPLIAWMSQVCQVQTVYTAEATSLYILGDKRLDSLHTQHHGIQKMSHDKQVVSYTKGLREMRVARIPNLCNR